MENGEKRGNSPFVMILVPMFIAMGYDAIVGITYVQLCGNSDYALVKFWQNPFGLAVAQELLEPPVMSHA